MTRIKFKLRPTWHETGAAYDGRPVLVAESPANLLLRLKGTRTVMRLPWSLALLKAAQVEAAANRLERINARAARRKGGGR